MKTRRKLFLEGPILQALVTLSVPIILGNILQTGYQLTDAFWVGRLGAASVAAISVSFPVMFLTIALGSGLAAAGATLTAQYTGAGRPEMVDHIAGQTMVMVALTSIVLGGAAYGFTPDLLRLMGVSPDVYGNALGFLHISFVGVIFLFMFAMFQALMRGVGETRIPLFVVCGTVVLNFVLDPLLIFGWGPIPRSGVVGSAMATLITQGLAATLGMGILMRGRHGIKLRLSSLVPDWHYVKRAFLLGFPASIELSTRALGVMVMAFIVVGFGTMTTAAYGVGSNIMGVVLIPATGISMAVSTLVGQNMGAGNIERAARVTLLGTFAGFVVLSLAAIVAYAFAPALVAFFIPRDPAVIAAGAGFIRIMCPAWGFMGVQLCLAGAFRASGNMLIAMVLALVSQFMLQFPLAFILSQHTGLGAQGIWWSFPVTNVILAVVAVAWFAKGGWKNTRLTEDERQTVSVIDETIIESGLH